MLKKYWQVAKPGIIIGNLISVAGGFFLASKGSIDLMLFFYAALGVSLVVASGCVFNNFIDRDIDTLMERTRDRALVQGLISPRAALIYASVLGLLGIFVLLFGTNIIDVTVVLVGFIIYVGVYSLSLKRNSVHGTLIGSLAGAMPPVVGYCAVSQQFDLGAAILLLIFSIWQMPHSYAIAIFRFNDYRAASIPVLPVAKTIQSAKHQILLYLIAFNLATPLLYLAGYTGIWYLIITSAFGLYWLYIAWAGLKTKKDTAWAKKVFFTSILIVMVQSLMMSVDTVG
ncbi:heme o synthase [Methylophaga sulfidovorans]|uniref:Protoheme IX farnesyltransferase n=1 Tax=Methylophaga sulfidovorans TaxID=45496 RepID=A0A1I4BLZ5_9GAMM|nr:heme o synthase [Methylophaga sulfidovorans]SFK69009.1 protoheme IX farnesyltransferase [Methylophaga sulfidovorans]